MSSTEGAAGTRAAIQHSANGRRTAIVRVEGFGDFRIRSITAKERRELQLWNAENPESNDVEIGLVLRCLVDDDGNRVYRSSEVNAFDNADAFLIASLIDACLEFTGLPKFQLDPDRVGELAKN